MGFLSSLRDKAMTAIANGLAGYFQPRWAVPPRRNARDWLDVAHKSPRLDPVDLIAQDVASAEYEIVQRPRGHRPDLEDIPVYNSPIYDIIENPMPDHPDIDGWTFRYLSEAYMQIMGECFWVIERRGMTPAALYIVPPNWVISTPTVQQNYYRVMPLGNISIQQINIEAQDMVWCKSPDLVNPYWRGRGRVESIGDELESDEFAAKFQKKFFYNDATPPILISAPGITQQDAERFKESWMQNLAGVYNARKPGIIPAEMKVEKVTDSPRELDFNESRRFLSDVCREHFAIPPELFGDSKNSNRATIESADYLYKKNVVSRRLRRWEMIYNRQLCPQFPGDQIVKFHDVVPEDTAFKLQKANEGLSRGAITVNEWRKDNGLKESEDGNVYLRPLGLQVVPVGSKPAKVLEISPEPEKDEDEKPIDIGKAMRYSVAKSAVKSLTDEVKQSYHKSIDAASTADEQLFIDAVKSIGEEQHSAISAEFRAARKLGQSYTQAMDTACEAVFGKSADEAVAAKLTPAWFTTMHDGAQKAAELLGLSPNFDLYNVYFSQWVNEVGAKQISGAINETTKAALQKTIADAVEAGESSAKIAQRVADEFARLTGEDMTATRAMLIARTEAQRSINYGQLVTYKEEGVGRKEWLANSFGPYARDGHQSLSGTEIGIDQDFTDPETGATAPAPGMFNDPAEDANCFIPETIVSGAFVAGSKSFYSGPVREIKTSRGYSLTVTPNHPIFTPDGMVPAKELAKGGNVFSYCGEIGDLFCSEIDNKDFPARIDNIFNSRWPCRAQAMPVPLDFHGDGQFVNGKIDVVRANGLLWSAGNIENERKDADDFGLIASAKLKRFRKADGAFDFRLDASMASSDSIPSSAALPLDGIGVELDFGPFKALGVGPAAKWNPGFNKPGPENCSCDSGFIGQLFEASSGKITSDEIVEIIDRDFSGHVYDLQSVDHYILSNGIVSSNCRCTILPVVE